MTTFLFVMFKHCAESCLAEDALRCTANCAANELCASAVLERGVNVICKVGSLYDCSARPLRQVEVICGVRNVLLKLQINLSALKSPAGGVRSFR